jgi:FKBP-type peptidyl-prolyl cis-trans isomerase FkpA
MGLNDDKMQFSRPYMTLNRLILLLPLGMTISCSSPPQDPSAQSAYLEKAASAPGAVRTPSGLVYRELRPGTGSSPAPTDTVKVNYKGTLIDGKKFDSNDGIKFPLNRVIPCWTEGVQKMKVGGKAELVCPAKIGYGDSGAPPDIPGGATLVFEIELLGIG